MTMRTLRLLLLIDIASLIVVAAIHAGILFGGPFDRASLYEAAVAVVLGVGLALTWAGPAVARWGAFVAQLLALFGVGTGIYMASRGMAPNTTWDFVYHAFAVVFLLAGILVALRLPPSSDAAGGHAVNRTYGRGQT
jgi:hypothetical protein